MRKAFTILTFLALVICVWAQSPQRMSYQAVIRNSSNALVTSTVIGMQISILQGSTSGAVVYTETQTPTTNANGLVSIEIGGSTGFSTIDWSAGPYFIKTETDPTGGANYTISGTNQLLSVPYALHAKTAESIVGGITETDPVFVASPANGIASANITSWNTSYSWGNHASAGYLTSFTETDPKVGSNSTNYLSKWNGTSLVSSSIFDNGNVGIGTATPDASAKVEISSTTAGFLISRMTTVQRNAIVSPAAGLQIYNTDINCLETWNSNGWISVCGGSILFNGQAIIGSAPNSWIQKANFGGTTRFLATGFSIGSKGYIGTGNAAGNNTKDFWEYDPGTNVWTQKADFGGTARYGAVGFSIGNKGYIGTGMETSIEKKDFWEYNPGTNLWTQKADFGGAARYEAVGFSIGAKGYIGTGMGSPYSNDFWEYDPGTNLWTQKANFLGGNRYAAVGFSIGSKGYIGTGYDNNPPAFKDFWEYNPGSNLWTKKADFGGTARIRAVGFSIGSKGYIGTGYDYPNLTKDFWEFDPGSDAWVKKADLGGTARNLAIGFSVGNKGYIGTGNDGSDLNDFWEYSQ